MDLASILIALILVGAVLYLIGILPIEGTVKTVIKVVAIVAVAIWLLRVLSPYLP